MIAMCEKCSATLVSIPDPTRPGCRLFECKACGHTSRTAYIAKSHCCQEEVERVPDEKFPYVCSRCGGSCEFADPHTPSFERMAPHARYIPDERERSALEAVCKGYDLCMKTYFEEIDRILR